MATLIVPLGRQKDDLSDDGDRVWCDIFSTEYPKTGVCAACQVKNRLGRNNNLNVWVNKCGLTLDHHDGVDVHLINAIKD